MRFSSRFLLFAASTAWSLWKSEGTAGASPNPAAYNYGQQQQHQQQQQPDQGGWQSQATSYGNYQQPEPTPETEPDQQEPEASSPLPPGWSEHMDPSSGQLYYFNSAEGITTWDRPEAEAETEVAAEENEGGAPFRDTRDAAAPVEEQTGTDTPIISGPDTAACFPLEESLGYEPEQQKPQADLTRTEERSPEPQAWQQQPKEPDTHPNLKAQIQAWPESTGASKAPSPESGVWGMRPGGEDAMDGEERQPPFGLQAPNLQGGRPGGPTGEAPPDSLQHRPEERETPAMEPHVRQPAPGWGAPQAEEPATEPMRKEMPWDRQPQNQFSRPPLSATGTDPASLESPGRQSQVPLWQQQPGQGGEAPKPQEPRQGQTQPLNPQQGRPMPGQQQPREDQRLLQQQQQQPPQQMQRPPHQGPPGQQQQPPQQMQRPPHQGPPGRQQGPPGQQQGPPGQQQGPPGQQQGPPGQQQGPLGQQQGPPGQQRGPLGQQQGPPDQHQGPPGQHQGPPGQQQGPPGQQRPPQQQHPHGQYPQQQHGNYQQSPQYGNSPYGQYNQYGSYGGAPPQGYGQQPQSGNQLVTQTPVATTAVKETLGTAWQGLLGFSNRTKDAVESARNTVVSGAKEAGQSITSTSSTWWGQAKNTLGSVFESSENEQPSSYALSGRYSAPPGQVGQGPPGYPQQQGYPPPQQGYPPPQQGYPPPQQQGYPPQQQGYPPSQQGWYPPGYTPPQPGTDPSYPHNEQQQGQRQGQPPLQSQWGPGGQGQPRQQQPHDPGRLGQRPPPGAYPPQPGQGQRPPPQQQQQQQQQQHPPQRPPEQRKPDPWQHPALGPDGF